MHLKRRMWRLKMHILFFVQTEGCKAEAQNVCPDGKPGGTYW